MSDNLNKAAKEALDTARILQENGRIPLYLGVNGMLALMHKEIDNYINQSTEQKSLLTLVAYGLFALFLSKEEDEWDELAQLSDVIEEETPRPETEWTEEELPPEGTVIQTDRRWTPVAPGKPLSEARRGEETEEEEVESEREEEESTGPGEREPV